VWCCQRSARGRILDTQRILVLGLLAGLFLIAVWGRLVRHAQGKNKAENIRSEPAGIIQRPAAPRFPAIKDDHERKIDPSG